MGGEIPVKTREVSKEYLLGTTTVSALRGVSLDSAKGERIVGLRREMQQRSGTAFLIATHDPLVTSHAEERSKIHNGRLEG